MKKSISFLVMLFIVIGVNAQIGEPETMGSFDFGAELRRTVNAPNSPEAQAFTQYGDTQVNYYTGTPNIEVPIHVFQGREFSVPMSLTYDASGVKVEQIATASGLSWNLNVGGRISRIVNGAPDDYQVSSPSPYLTIFNTDVRTPMLAYINERVEFPNRSDVTDYYAFLNRINTNEYDTQPDYFSLNAIGINDYIVFDLENLEPRALKNPRIKVDANITYSGITNIANITGWTVTNEDGTIYTFDLAEKTRYEGDDYNTNSTFGIIKEYNSSWVLTKIESPNGKDIFDFEYTSTGLWTQEQIMTSASRASDLINEDTPATVTTPWATFGFIPTYKIDQQILNRIKHTTAGTTREVATFGYGTRYDIDIDNALTDIWIKEDAVTTLKRVQLHHSYFGMAVGGNPSGEDPLDIRLKLDKVEFLSANNNTHEVYEFEYVSPQSTPRRSSFSQDYLGYYNGKPNSVMYPQMVVSGHTFLGADRDPVFSYGNIGMLDKITYPTGGYTELVFEPDSSPAFGEGTFTTVLKGQLSLTGDLIGFMNCMDPAKICKCDFGYYWCNDLYGSTNDPNVSEVVFEITEAKTYTLKYTNTVSGTSEGFKKMAFMFKRGDLSSSGTCMLSPLELPEIIDLNNGDRLVDMDDMYFDLDLEYGLDLDGEKEIFLTPGCYQITLVNPNQSETIGVQVLSEELIPGSDADDKPRAGFRIKSVKDYASDGVLSKHKEYLYKEGFESTVSSGRMLFNPQMYYTTPGLIPESAPSGGTWECVIDEVLYLHRMGSASGGNDPHIAYERVYEIIKYGIDDIGFYRHDYQPESKGGFWSSGPPASVNFFTPKPTPGKETQTSVFDKHLRPLNIVDNEYATISPTTGGSSYHYSTGFYLAHKPMRSYSMLYTRPYNNGFTYDFAPYRLGGTDLHSSNGAGDPICAWAFPLACQEPNNECYFTSYAPDFDLQLTVAQGKHSNIIRKTTQEFFPDYGIFILPGDETTSGINRSRTSEENYTYDPNVDFLLKEITTEDSNGEEIKSTFYYPREFPLDPTYVNMTGDNQLMVPIVTEKELNGRKVERKNNFLTTGSGYYVSSVETSKNSTQGGASTSNSLETRMHYEYDAQGNVSMVYQYLEATGGGGPTPTIPINVTTIIYGYGYRYPIAQIQNATYSEVIAALGVSVSALQTMNESDLRNEMETLRLALPDALVSSYTYNPNIGVSSMTDPTGNTMYYEYNEFHQLEKVKDRDGNLMSKNKYNYRVNN